jgi:branched-chain amino acid aminotransferase/4-amino-4-deoxychorismate lyase
VTSERDRGLLLGDGLFETVLWDGGRPVRFEAHADRMARGCALLGLPRPLAGDLLGAAEAALDEAGLRASRAAVRLTWSAGEGGRGLDRPGASAPRLLASAAPAPKPEGPARLITAAVRRNEGSPASRVKSLSYIDSVLARAEARAAGADEALMLNNRGEVACAAAANLFWVRDGRLFTPDLACGVLDGITRAAVIAAAERDGVASEVVRAARPVLDGAEALFLTNSLIGVRPVSALDGARFGAHPLVQRLAVAAG